jgi:SEC-C motif
VPCGSGRKAKRCCGIARGPAEDELLRAFVAGEALVASVWLAGCEDDELASLWDELLELPERHLSLHLPLPRLVAPELQRLIDALRDDDAEETGEALDDALPRLDTAAARAALTRAVIDLRDAGWLEGRLAALAILDLASRSAALVRVSLVEAAAVAAGVARTPGGLVVAQTLTA